MDQPDYKFIADLLDFVSSILPYKVHFLVALGQGLIVIQALIWSKYILSNNTINNNVPEFLVNKIYHNYSKIYGLLLLLAGIFLILPLIFDTSYSISAFALILIIFFCVFSAWPSGAKFQLKKYSIIVVSVILIVFMFWERADPLNQATKLCFKALKWRMYESSWQEIHDKEAPKVGDLAPDFEILSTDQLDTLRLSDYRHKMPVALIFGSHTCPPHSDGTLTIQKLYDAYKDQVAFVNVYLKEAHPIDKWWLGESKTQKVIFDWSGTRAQRQVDEPITFEERLKVAANYRKELYDNQLPVYVDFMDDRIGEMYAAKPTRIYLINKEGGVIYNPGFGPMAFNAKHLEKEIKKHLEINTN